MHFFSKLVALTLGYNCVKDLRVTKIGLKRFGGKLEAKNCFQIQSWTKYLKQTLIFLWKVQLLFSRSFLLVLKKFSFGEEDWALCYDSMKFWDFLGIS